MSSYAGIAWSIVGKFDRRGSSLRYSARSVICRPSARGKIRQQEIHRTESPSSFVL